MAQDETGERTAEPTAERTAEPTAEQGGAEPWWKSAVVYQVYPASFADSNGDGMGDLGGIIAHLDYLVDLGVDVVWLSPIFRTPWNDSGYDVSDYQDIDQRFGTLDDFDALLAAVHDRGLKLILDLVANHTSDEHEWFVESRQSTQSARRDWYVWQPPRRGFIGGEPGAEPTNWRSEFHESAWDFDPGTGEYFLHLYSRKQPDLNWENPEVREAVYAMMRWWLDRGVDGFRMDVINKISKLLPFADAPEEPGRRFTNARAMYVNGPRVHEFVQEMHREALAPYGDRLLTVGETSGVTIEHARLFTDQARGELDMVFTFEHVRMDQGADTFDMVPFDLVTLKAIMARWQAGLADVGWNSLYWCNHDQPRIVSRWGNDGRYRVESAKLLGTILHLHRGTPYVYQGEELGMTNAVFETINDFHDVAALNYYAYEVVGGFDPDQVLTKMRRAARDNARSPMQWDDSVSAGFTTGEPWQRVNPNHMTINAAADVADPASVWHHYRRLIELRHTHAVVAFGDFTMLLADHPTVYAFTRRLGDETLLVIGNFSDNPITVDIDEPFGSNWAASESLLGNYALANPDAGLSLRPWECRVQRSRPDS